MTRNMSIRPAAVAGTWYPGTAGALAREVDACLEAAPSGPDGEVSAIVAPHAGLMFSGRVGACAFKAAAAGQYESAVLVGPSHYVGFEGVSVFPEGAFDTPLGSVAVDAGLAARIAEADVVRGVPAAHVREHSIEMQLPFLRRLFPTLPMVPVLMGYQRRATIEALATALSNALRGRRVLLLASTDLSHYFDAATAGELDARVRARIDAFDPEGLLELLEQYPESERGRYVACGGGPAVSVLLAARDLGARDARVLRYAHSGEISGDYGGVVGYLAAAVGRFQPASGR
jgi:AmmeMemoRadiSam system protein B